MADRKVEVCVRTEFESGEECNGKIHWAENLQMLFAKGGLDREAAPSHGGVMVCKVDTGMDRRYEISANVTLVVEDADDNAPFPQAEESSEIERERRSIQ